MANSPGDSELQAIYDGLHEAGAIFSRLGQSATPTTESPPPPRGDATDADKLGAGEQIKKTAGQCQSPTLSEILTAANVATVRSRAMVFILVGASIIGFSAAWKALPIGWFHKRIAATIAAIDYLDEQQRIDDSNGHKDWLLSPLGIGDDPQAREQLLKAHRLETLQMSRDLWKEHLDKGRAVVIARQFVDAQHARAYLNALEQSRIESVNVLHIPIFGITFDVNDLGIIAGIGFVVLLITLRLALSRELQNLRVAFYAAKGCHRLKEAYEYLSMSQVMTLPPSIHSRPRRQTILARAPMLLVWCPCAVQIMIFAGDFGTIQLGQVTSSDLTNVALLLGFSSVFVIIILTFMCWHFSAEIDYEWNQAWLRVTKEPESPETVRVPRR